MWSLKTLLKGTFAKSTSCIRERVTGLTRIDASTWSALCIRNSFHENHVRLCRVLPHRFQFGIVRTIPPSAGFLRGIETDNNHAIGTPISLQHFDLAAPNKVGTARRRKIRRIGLSITRIEFGSCTAISMMRNAANSLHRLDQNVLKITLSMTFNMLQMNSMHY
jgi:hypothetical protein